MILRNVLIMLLTLAFTVSLAQTGGQTGETRPAWQSLELTDARTGETFTLGGFEGKAVFVEPMATWCTNCRRQLGNVNAAKQEVGEDVEFIALSIEGNLSNEALAQYAEKEGFDLRFAVITPELLRALVDTFGRAITSPPSTPHFIIRPDGSTTNLVTGIEPADALVAQLSQIRSD